MWVKKWVDYSSKYGLGYILSDNSVGVCFNDATKIVGRGPTFQYAQRRGNSDEVTLHSFQDYPPELKKKVTLLEHFKKHLCAEDSDESLERFVFIKKWLTTPHAMIFRLNTKVVQVYFHDRTEIMLCSVRKEVAFVNKSGEVTVSMLRTAGESGNLEMTKRLKYTKEILTSLLKGETVR